LDGSIDNTFGENGYTLTTIATAFDDANAMALQSDGKIVLAGRGNMGTNNDIAVTRHFNGQNVNVEETLLGGFSIYPNPISGGDLSIVSSSERIESCRIFSADGRLVFDQLEPQNALTLRLNIDELPSGFYSIIINDNTTAKLVIRD
jgi:Uma2 family endonuclease